VSKIRVLLLTNRDSDNVGDQIIEATVTSLLEAAFANLDIPNDGFEISSRAAGIISRAYMRTMDPALLEGARKAISGADVIVFGGAPLFNYTYQSFYLRTIMTLELAQEYGVPVLFSSIGVEPFNADNPKSVALKEALALPVVRQITTRDDYESLQKYVEGTDIPIAHVSDPAVFADIVFRKKPGKAAPAPPAPPTFSRRMKRRLRRIARSILRRPAPSPAKVRPAVVAAATRPASKRIGLVATRAGIFKDNGITFTEDDQRQFWLDVTALLAERGYDYRIFTTGHFTDEVFIDAFARANNLPLSKVAITVNSPEELIDELTACAGVIAYRLHASITSFAYEIPSVGLSWNFKVPYFYESVGHGDRALDHTRWNATEVVDALEKAIGEGVTKDEAFLMSVYETLFAGIKGIFAPASERESYTYAELHDNLPRYPGTSHSQYQAKVKNKLRRAYEQYQRYSTYYARAQDAKAARAAKADPDS
jgi:polysaccharide pyruvyl transferase WcaK-like protein